ncbi:MAG: hypothetical protein LBC56_07830 [Oscillospiraceae bacterium]|jgi:hypothetical protein|nr:hypothetical protein [Oscillospiraceae bacterium]
MADSRTSTICGAAGCSGCCDKSVSSAAAAAEDGGKSYNTEGFREAVCINTEKIYDSCSDKDCLEDLQVYFTVEGQQIIDEAMNVKIKEIEVLQVAVDMEEIPFNQGFYSVELTFYFDVTCCVYITQGSQPVTVHGLAIFTKKVILYGSVGSVKTFDGYGEDIQPVTDLPKVTVSVATPIALGIKILDPKDCSTNSCCLNAVPTGVCDYYDGNFNVIRAERAIYVSIGMFTIISIARRVQMMIPAYDFCLPDKSCDGDMVTSQDDPCELFRKIKFPVDQFFPPKFRDPDCN